MMDRETELRAQLAELRHQHAAAQSGIPALLAVGGDTAATRAEAAELERHILDTERQLEEAIAQRQAEAHSAIATAAGVIAADAENTIVTKLAALQPPEHP
jgi:hypothetical protein